MVKIKALSSFLEHRKPIYTCNLNCFCILYTPFRKDVDLTWPNRSLGTQVAFSFLVNDWPGGLVVNTLDCQFRGPGSGFV